MTARYLALSCNGMSPWREPRRVFPSTAIRRRCPAAGVVAVAAQVLNGAQDADRARVERRGVRDPHDTQRGVDGLAGIRPQVSTIAHYSC